MRMFYKVLIIMIVLSSSRSLRARRKKRIKPPKIPGKSNLLKIQHLPGIAFKAECTGWSTLNNKDFCDNTVQCPRGIDEMNAYNNTSLNLTYSVVRCNNVDSAINKTCLLNEEQFCSEVISCVGYSPCDHGCSTHFLCPDGKTCLKRSTVCDRDTCNDCPSLDSWPNGPGFKCARNSVKCKLPQLLLWDGVQDCDDGSDLCYGEPGGSTTGIPTDIRNENGVKFNTSRCFECLDGTTIINKQSICDGVFDCPDLSDECLCDGDTPSICSSVVTPELSTNEGTKRLNPSVCLPGQVTCGENKCISRSEVCDGKIDCTDAIDESVSFCEGTKSCANVTTPLELCRCSHLAENTCYQKTATYCDNETECQAVRYKYDYPAEDECSGSCLTNRNDSLHNFSDVDCSLPDRTRDSFICRGIGSERKINISKLCDGELDCGSSYVIRNDEGKCPTRFRCSAMGGKISILKVQRCNGYTDCFHGLDERNCRRRYQCSALNGTKESIAEREKCDFVINCDDSSDELNCSTTTRFYCENGEPLFVRARQMFNGVGDCSDWSDECPTERASDDNVLSSRYELIANPILRVLVWIMGILALIGNAVVLVTTVRILWSMDSSSTSLRNNHLLVLNLAVSDILMGIYLIILGSAGVQYSGIYCSNDLAWRSGNTCTAMGILVVLSSESSVMTMVLLTSFRLYAIFNPLKSITTPKPRIAILLIVLCWLISAILAFLPISYQFQNVFSRKALMENNPFFSNAIVRFSEFKLFLDRVAPYASYNSSDAVAFQPLIRNIRGASSWLQLQEILNSTQLHLPNLNFINYFGYYSESSVCIPRIFVTTSDTAWSFSIAITTFNFIAFIFVASAYVAIYAKSVTGNAIRKENTRSTISAKAKANRQTTRIQKKVLRLVITDFCCWVPITIMAFINFSGVKVPNVAYAVSAIVLLPINSALNPIIYSNVWEILYKKIKHKKKKGDSPPTKSSQQISSTNL